MAAGGGGQASKVLELHSVFPSPTEFVVVPGSPSPEFLSLAWLLCLRTYSSTMGACSAANRSEPKILGEGGDVTRSEL